jgi:hypothetical protein
VAQARIIGAASYENAGFVANTEADSHADTFVSKNNCVPINYTERSCDVESYSNYYASVKNVPIITAEMGLTAATGMNYILIFPEALYMPTLEHSLFNPNQLRQFGTIVQDNPYSRESMGITSLDGDFTACLQSKGTDIYIKTWAPSQVDLESYPHVILSSAALWNQRDVRFPGTTALEQEEIESRNIMATAVTVLLEEEHKLDNDVLFDIEQIRTRIISSARVTGSGLEQKWEARKIQETRQTMLPPLVMPGPIEEMELQPPAIFLSKDQHSNRTSKDLSERWGLSIAQAALMVRVTTRRLVRSAIMPLARHYRVDQMFAPNQLQGTFATDTMDM